MRIGMGCEVSGVRGSPMAVSSYRDLKVWQKGMDMVGASYEVTKHFPQTELYGLVSQIQRASVSIPANIAEGHGREHLGDYVHHLSIANGSLMELETHFLLAGRLGYLKAEPLNQLLDRTAEIGRMLAGLIRSLKKSQGVP
jgi:four helix bundle protein